MTRLSSRATPRCQAHGHKISRVIFSVVLLLADVVGAFAADRAAWSAFAKQPDRWYRSEEGRRITENILSWQSVEGSWPKNQDNTTQPFAGDRKTIKGTFDNGATTDELRFLARAFRAIRNPRCEGAFLKELDHILKAQYPSGGWPQFFPPDRQYHRHITFNDHAMVRLMIFLREVATSGDYSFVDAERRRASQASFDRGIQCILKCQIVVNGKPTVWCAQHDEVDYSPRPARSFELVSLSGCESVPILQLLMSLDQPSPEVRRAIQRAAEWFAASQITGIRVERINGDQHVVPDPAAPPLWARFYEMDTGRPFFCGRDGVKKYSLAEIELERRSHYAWYGDWGQPVAADYARWKAKWLSPESVAAHKTVVLAIIGDSTVCNYALTNDTRGWGMFIQDYFKDSVRVLNLARSGRSSKSFITEGLWQKTLDAKPDFVLIQFGHNDSHARTEPKATDAASDFRDYLRRYIQETRAIGATPILVTPMHRRSFTADGKLSDNLKPYADAMKAVAAETKVSVIDVHTKSGLLFEKLGEAGSMAFANRPEDRTHFNEKGAKAMAELVMQGLPAAEPALKPYLK